MNNSYNVENGKADVRESWWNRRSKLEKKLTATSAISLFVIVVLVVVIIVFFTRPATTCLSSSCVHISNELLEHMDTTANPCEDFYQFTCGNFLDNVQLDGEPVKGVDTLLYENVQDRVRGIIEEPEAIDDPGSIVLAKKLYKACMNQSAIEDRGLKLIKDSLKQIGGWPVLEGNNWVERDFEWKAATYKLRELGYGFEFFIGLQIVTDENDKSKRIIEIGKPFSMLNRATEEEEELYFNFMVNISVVFGADRSRAKDEFRDVIDFQKRLFSTNPTDEEEDDDNYDPLTISELQYKFRDVPWWEYINRLQFPAPNISYDQIVTVSNTGYILKLQNVLRSTPARVLANYIAWRTVREHSSFLTGEIWDLIRKYHDGLNTENELPPRMKLCSEIVDYKFAMPLQAAYIRKHFSVKGKLQVTQTLQSIKDEFKDVLTNLEWIDDETRTTAMERLAISNHYIAYPNDLLDQHKIEQRYIGYQIDEDNYLSSILNINYYTTNFKFQQLHEPVEKDQELNEAYATYTETYYTAADNTITIPAGFLQDVIYGEDRPQYLNYGSLGSTIGHQVFHTVFEGQGCKKDAKYYEWISTYSLMHFNEKLSCIAMHYGKYPVPEVLEHLNSSNTKYEDVADIAGVKLAYNAYKKWVSNNGPEQKLPGLDYTPEQLFWISSAIRFCKKSTPAALESRIAHSYRSPDKFRALGTLRNSEKFSRDFNCPTTSYMNAEDKCEIW